MPVGCPHVIYVPSFDQYTSKDHLRLCDGIATVLWKLSPEDCRLFFDYKIDKFEMAFRTGRKYRDKKVFIGRKGHEVVVSLTAIF